MEKTTKLIDYSSLQSLSAIWGIAAQKFGDIIALHDPHSKPEVILTYSQLNQQIRQFATGLQAMGIKPDAKVALFADNSPRWLIADQGMMMAGAANAVRSSQADKQELLYIFQDSNSTCLVIEDAKTLKKLRPELDDLPVELVVLLTDETPQLEALKILNFSQLMSAGANYNLQPVTQTKQSLATLIYTSGTTGQPKGAMLSHGNLLHQVVSFPDILQPHPGDRVLSILPTWHAYERTCEYYLLSQGCSQIYTNLRSVKKDLKHYQPSYMVAVPRLWESIYEGVQKQFREQPESKQKLVNFFLNISEQYILAKRIANNLSLEHLHSSAIERLVAQIKAIFLTPIHILGDKIVYQKVREATGGKIKAVISGGGSLANHLENFFEIVGINILVGYGLTETSPVATVRTLNHNLRGSSGKAIAHTEIKIVDPETRKPLAKGEKGLVLIRGQQIMQGYYHKPEATKKAIDPDGWFDSGDLGWLTPNNDLVLTGRAKDTIVLTNGENIEPQPIEDACLRSPYIAQIMLVGQDQRSLGALIVPNLEALEKWAATQQIKLQIPDPHTAWQEVKNSDLYSKPILDLFRQELNREVQTRPGYRPDDRITVYELMLEPFSVENGMMTQTLKIKRNIVQERYQEVIDKMFS